MNLALTIQDTIKIAGVGRSKLYEEISNGRLRAVKCGRRTLIMADDLRGYLDNLPAVQPKKLQDPASDAEMPGSSGHGEVP